MVASPENLGNRKLDEVLAMDTEVKQLLYKEINELMVTSDQFKKDLDLKTSQFEKLKCDFIFNLRLINERDLVIKKLNERISSLIKNIHSRDILISEIKASLDRTQSELAQVKTSEVKLRGDIEESLHETVKREQKLLEKHNTLIETFRKTETEERIKLQNNINRLQSELEMERLHSAVNLQTAIDDAIKEKEKLKADTAQKLFDLELRMHLAEETAELANKSKHDYISEISCKEGELSKLNCKLSEINKIVELQKLEIQDLQVQLKESKQKYLLLESAQVQNEKLVLSQKTDLTEEIDNLKSKLQRHEQEALSMTLKHEEQVNSLQIENQKLVESLTKEKQQTQKIIDLWKEEKVKCQHAEHTVRILQAEIKHLNEDLKQALIKPDINQQELHHCKHDHIIHQLNHLNDTCDKLEEENSRLKQTISMMSQQAKQFAQLSLTPNINKTMHEYNQLDETNQNAKLSAAIKQIYRLAVEKQSLIELSNRLQAKLRQLTDHDDNKPMNNDHSSKHKGISISNDKYVNNIQNSMVDNREVTHIVKNMNKPLNNDISSNVININQSENPMYNHHSLHDAESSSIITGKGSISTIFKLLDEVASLGSENDGECLQHIDRFLIQGKHKHITTPRLKRK
ncbi:coiled coil domain containing protein 57 [Schistosoma japonicum]|nr:coiled coil domain containing protein 57 [Schistosoma japonicum]